VSIIQAGEETGSDILNAAIYFVVMSIALLGMVVAIKKIPRTEEGYYRGCGCSASLVGIVGLLVFLGWVASLANLIFSVTGV
jgi:hypothetical protein